MKALGSCSPILAVAARVGAAQFANGIDDHGVHALYIGLERFLQIGDIEQPAVTGGLQLVGAALYNESVIEFHQAFLLFVFFLIFFHFIYFDGQHFGDNGCVGEAEERAVADGTDAASLLEVGGLERSQQLVVLVGIAIVEGVVGGEQQLVTHLCHRCQRCVKDVRFLDDELVVVNHHIAKAGCQIDESGSKGHIVDGLARCHDGVFDLRHVDDGAVAQDDVDVIVVVDDDQVVA